MAEQAEGQPQRKGGMGRVLTILAAVGAVVALLAFWRRRHSTEEEE